MVRIIDDKIVDTDKCEVILHVVTLISDKYYLKTIWGSFVLQEVPLGYKAISNPNLIKMELISEEEMRKILKEKDANKYIEIFGDKDLSEA